MLKSSFASLVPFVWVPSSSLGDSISSASLIFIPVGKASLPSLFTALGAYGAGQPAADYLGSCPPLTAWRLRRARAIDVVDSETGEILGLHQKGELRINTDFQMSMDGHQDVGMLTVVDRMKDMLKFRSWYLAPAKIEGILLSHPAVDAVVVVGLPHPEDGEHPVAAVVLRSHAVGTVTSEDIQNYIDQRVEDDYQLRGGVRIVDYIPVTSSGKNRRAAVRDLLLGDNI
ncbi:hypothetical protein ILUMI_15519 [Ignelater luminosus]|uniref:AMP-binding enzyme C-terminal domain-containing protein n=1 Tax=Ignelater luminosus TaxID=2038154 RepID=A0A8K0G913_IGNLU|nr:hypothetical protein ILUMI_15519 [Ignelater luminosus]